jgi:uncharacterized membrane protein YfcA
MGALTWLVLWCTAGGVVGWIMGARTGRNRAGLLLGAFMGVFGWVLILGARPRALAPDPGTAPPDVSPSSADAPTAALGASIEPR